MYDDLKDRLVRVFGFGKDPARREQLYDKLVALCRQHGDAAYRHIAACAAEARSAQYCDRYFCKAVASRLREHGFGDVHSVDLWDK